MKSIVTILLTDRRCNFNCSYCYARHDHTALLPIRKNLDFSVLNHIYESKIKEAKDRNEKLELETTFWGGEPFANPHLRDIVEYLRSKFDSSFFTITNGSLLDDSTVNWCIKNKFRVGISNDLAYQSNRGTQYFEDDEKSKAIAKLCNAGLVNDVQFVLSRNSPDIMKQLDYFNNWCKKYNVKKIPTFGWLPIKAYDNESIPLLFTDINDEATATMIRTMKEFVRTALINRDEPQLKQAFKREFLNAMYGLQGASRGNYVKGNGNMKVHAGCSVFNDHCYDLLGREWSCPHYFEKDPEHPVIFDYIPSDYCYKCSFIGECNEICASATDEDRKRSCHSLKMIYGTIRQAILEYSDEEVRKTYVLNNIEDLRKLSLDTIC